jgi:hypothetical protein
MTTTQNAGDSLSVRLEHHARDIEKEAWPDLRSLPGLLREVREAIQAGEALASTPSRVIPQADELDKLAAQLRSHQPVMTDESVSLLINAASVLRGMVLIHEHREDEVKRLHERQALLDAEDPGVVAKRVATELRDATVATPFLDAKLRVTMESAATLLEMQGRIIQRGREPAPEPDWPPQKSDGRTMSLAGITVAKMNDGTVELSVRVAHRMVLTTLTDNAAETLGAYLAPRPQPAPAQPLADKHLEELRAYLDQDSVLRQDYPPDLRAYSFEPALWRALRDHLNSHMEAGYSAPEVITADWVRGWGMEAINATTREAMLRIASHIEDLEERADRFERQAAPGIADSKPGDLDDIAEFLMAFARDEARLGAVTIARKMRAAALHIQDLEKRLMGHGMQRGPSFADGVAAVADAIQHPESDHPEMNTPGDAVRLAAWIRENVHAPDGDPLRELSAGTDMTPTPHVLQVLEHWARVNDKTGNQGEARLIRTVARELRRVRNVCLAGVEGGAPGGPEVDPDFLELDEAMREEISRGTYKVRGLEPAPRPLVIDWDKVSREADQTATQDGLSQRVEEGPAGPVFATVETEGAGMMLTTDAWVEKLHDLADRRASLTGTDRDHLRRAAGHMRDLDRAAAASPSGFDWESMTWRESVEKLAAARIRLAHLESIERAKRGLIPSSCHREGDPVKLQEIRDRSRSLWGRSGTFQDGVEACAKAVRRREMPFPAAPHTRSQLSDWLLDTVKPYDSEVRRHEMAAAMAKSRALETAAEMRRSALRDEMSEEDRAVLLQAADNLEAAWK